MEVHPIEKSGTAQGIQPIRMQKGAIILNAQHADKSSEFIGMGIHCQQSIPSFDILTSNNLSSWSERQEIWFGGVEIKVNNHNTSTHA